MPRKKLIRSDLFPYHVTYRVSNREAFALPLADMWKLVSDELYRISYACEARIHAFALMPNHVHLLISTPGLDLGRTMAEFGGSLTLAYNKKAGRSGHLFGGRYHWSIVQSPVYYSYVLKYIYRNPVRARLCSRVEDWPYSSLHGLLGKSHLPFPLHFPEPERRGEIGLVPYEFDDLLTWLNEPFQKELLAELDRGVKRKVFFLKKEIKVEPISS